MNIDLTPEYRKNLKNLAKKYQNSRWVKIAEVNPNEHCCS
jgi:mRNA-degrading endonuclease RelE of RelBE toxin-antitoxin system